MLTRSPVVSVILPVRNGERFVAEAIESICLQSFTELELIVVDDGSTDHTDLICEQFARLDSRVKLVSQDPCGLAASLNRAVALSKGRYVARMDADDIAFCDRIEKQARFLDAHADVALVSSGYVPIGERLDDTLGAPILHPSDSESIYALLGFCTPICHPAVMARQEVLRLFPYRPGVSAEDHDLWCRIARVARLANIEEPLLYYRRHTQSVTARSFRKLRNSTVRSAGLHILSNPLRYRRACLHCATLDRARYSSINWKWLDRMLWLSGIAVPSCK